MQAKVGQLPSYTDDQVKAKLLEAGASGTVYALVMPETEAALSWVVDGCNQDQAINEVIQFSLAAGSSAASAEQFGDNVQRSLIDRLAKMRSEHYFGMYHEPWTQKQDVLHEAYFDRWFDWVSPVASIDRRAFSYCYPTSGASEGIFKIMSEHAAACRDVGGGATIHMFDGEYEGFPAYAASLGLAVTRHKRQDWKAAIHEVGRHDQFWISQPSAIDGQVWDQFDQFVQCLGATKPDAQLIPDLTYVGNVAKPLRIALDAEIIPAVVFSHSKPFGGYYQRVGGVVARREYPSLFGNKWFKNLQSLAWATEMMRRHDVHALAKKYRPVQERATRLVGQSLGIPGLEPADVNLLAIAKPEQQVPDLLQHVLRGSGDETVIRLCLTPALTCLIRPDMAPQTYPSLSARWSELASENHS